MQPSADSKPVPILAVHGMRVSSSMWQPLQRRLSRPVVTADLPGHGVRRGSAFSIEASLQVIVEALDDLATPAVLVGHSLGGYLAIRAARAAPEQVAGVVAIGCSTAPGSRLLPAYRLFAAALAHRPELGNRLSDKGFRSQLDDESYRAVHAGGYSCEIAPQVVEAVAGLDPLADLAGYPGPVWLVNGSLDQFRIGERRFLDACQDGRLIVWPGLTHAGVIGATDRIATLIEDACAVVEARARAQR